MGFTRPAAPPAGSKAAARVGYVGGLIKACVFGLRAGEHAAGKMQAK